MSKLKIGILISGRGSNMAALLEACAAPDFPAAVKVVISNRPDAAGLAHAADVGITTHVIDHTAYEDRQAFEAAVTQVLEACQVDLICLAGFMRLLEAGFVNRWQDRLINIHPSLLPAYKGLNTHDRVIQDGCKITGCTVHYVRPDMDTGPIILQAAVPVLPGDTEAVLAARVLTAEHMIYPEAVRLIALGAIRASKNRVVVSDPTALTEAAPDTVLTSPVTPTPF